MTARSNAYRQNTNCCAAPAAARTSARISPIMDTAIILAVSIFVCLLDVRLFLT